MAWEFITGTIARGWREIAVNVDSEQEKLIFKRISGNITAKDTNIEVCMQLFCIFASDFDII
jgi:hypothetical protein